MEDLRKKHGPKIEEWTFTNQIKADLAANLKILLEGRLLELVKTARSCQLGSIRQKITDVGNVVFDVAKGGGGRTVSTTATRSGPSRSRRGGSARSGRPQEVGVRVIGAPSRSATRRPRRRSRPCRGSASRSTSRSSPTWARP
jgi:hypothetical protein